MNPGTPGPDDERTRADKIAEAYERFHGLGEWHQRPQSYRQIAREMDVTHPTAAKWVREGEAAATTRDTVEQVVAKRALLGLTAELTRYGMTLLGIDDPELTAEERLARWDTVMPDLRGAIDQAAKMTGAYAPVRSEVVMNADANHAINRALDARREAHMARLDEERRRQIGDGS
jgi:transposase-like protein